jgi:hypothetical protein
MAFSGTKHALSIGTASSMWGRNGGNARAIASQNGIQIETASQLIEVQQMQIQSALTEPRLHHTTYA